MCSKSTWKVSFFKAVCFLILFWHLPNPANIYLFKFNNRSLRKRCESCSKLTIKIPEPRYRCRSGFLLLLLNIFHIFSSVSIVTFEQVNVYWECSLKLDREKQLWALTVRIKPFFVIVLFWTESLTYQCPRLFKSNRGITFSLWVMPKKEAMSCFGYCVNEKNLLIFVLTKFVF